MNKFRVGFGYDVHQLAKGRDLINRRCKTFPFKKGALGPFSKAQVLTPGV